MQRREFGAYSRPQDTFAEWERRAIRAQYLAMPERLRRETQERVRMLLADSERQNRLRPSALERLADCYDL